MVKRLHPCSAFKHESNFLPSSESCPTASSGEVFKIWLIRLDMDSRIPENVWELSPRLSGGVSVVSLPSSDVDLKKGVELRDNQSLWRLGCSRRTPQLVTLWGSGRLWTLEIGGLDRAILLLLLDHVKLCVRMSCPVRFLLSSVSKGSSGAEFERCFSQGLLRRRQRRALSLPDEQRDGFLFDPVCSSDVAFRGKLMVDEERKAKKA